MMVRIKQHLLDKIFQHGEETYNEECCGLLIGKGDLVTEVRRMRNTNSGTPTRRYNIDPLELMKVEDEVDERGDEIIGIYHSHPDHPAKPSQFDLDHSFPNLSYMVLAVEGGKAKEITSWRRKDSEKREFIQEKITEEKE